MSDVGRCGLCGGTLAARSYRGVPAGQCTTCHAVVLKGDEAEQLLGRPDQTGSDTPFPVDLFEAVTEPVGLPPPEPEQRWLIPLALTLGLAAGVLAVVLLLVGRRGPEADAAAPVEVAPDVVPVVGLRKAVSEAWAIVSEQPEVAAAKFRMILEVAPRDADATYGLGYALLRLGTKDEALLYLCRARGQAGDETSQEIDSLLAQESLTCSP